MKKVLVDLAQRTTLVKMQDVNIALFSLTSTGKSTMLILVKILLRQVLVKQQRKSKHISELASHFGMFLVEMMTYLIRVWNMSHSSKTWHDV